MQTIMKRNELSAEEKLAALGRKRAELIEEIENEYEHYCTEIKSKYEECPYCKDWYLKKSFEDEVIKEEQKGILVYSDCGYGDDDRYADIECLVTYRICPKGHKIKKNAERIRTIREYGR